jgi:hypothetical protein
MGFGDRSVGPSVGFGGSLSGLRLEWVVEELRAQGFLPPEKDSPDLLELLDRKVRGKALAGRAHRRRVEVPVAGDGRQQLTVHQVARRLNVCDKTVRKMIGDGDLRLLSYG